MIAQQTLQNIWMNVCTQASNHNSVNLWKKIINWKFIPNSCEWVINTITIKGFSIDLYKFQMFPLNNYIGNAHLNSTGSDRTTSIEWKSIYKERLNFYSSVNRCEFSVEIWWVLHTSQCIQCEMYHFREKNAVEFINECNVCLNLSACSFFNLMNVKKFINAAKKNQHT